MLISFLYWTSLWNLIWKIWKWMIYSRVFVGKYKLNSIRVKSFISMNVHVTKKSNSKRSKDKKGENERNKQWDWSSFCLSSNEPQRLFSCEKPIFMWSIHLKCRLIWNEMIHKWHTTHIHMRFCEQNDIIDISVI